MDNNIDTVIDNVIQATSVNDLEEPIKNLMALARNNSTELSGLWKIVNGVRDRIKTINDLTNLEKNEGISQNIREKVINWFGTLANILHSRNLLTAATGILIELWNEFGYHQFELNKNASELKHVLRAGVGMYLGYLYGQQEPGAAIWWLLHAHADDLIDQHQEGGGAARDVLRLAFGVSKDVFDFMKKCADEDLESGQQHALFAEHVVMQLSLRHEYSNLFSFPTSLVEFPIGRAYATTMLNRVKKNPEGKPLEELARYIMLLLAGWVPTENLYHIRTRIDSDLIARYMREPEAISYAHSRAILVECKNIAKPLTVSDTGYFLYRMYFHQVNVGILFARKNVSGRKSNDDVAQNKNSMYLLDLAFQRDGTAVIVIDMSDIQELVDGKKTIWALIDNRIVERRFGKTNT